MKKNSVLLVAYILVFILIDCTIATGKVSFPQPTVNYSPKKVYSISFDTVWDVIIRVLDENRIMVISIDKSTGIIITDYIQGASKAYWFGLGGIGNSRYKYNIKLSKQGIKDIKLSIITKLEQTLQGEGASTPYRDLSKQNPQLVNQLENWLYEKIENTIQQTKVTVETETISPSASNIENKLNTLKRLKEEGLMTEKEYIQNMQAVLEKL